MILTINNTQYLEVKSRDYLWELLQNIHQQNADIYLEFSNNADGERPSLMLLKNGDLCCLFYYRYRGDSGTTIYQTQSLEQASNIHFELANGESYTTSINNCLDFEAGYSILVHFFDTNGERADWINWSRD
jgi:hypothetical protein